MSTSPYFQELISELKQQELPKNKIAKLKLQLCRVHGVKQIPSDMQILLHAREEDLPRLKYLQTKPVRTISGVCPVALMTAPHHCPHGKCTFCPGGPGSVFGDVPQSYTGKEPATMRGIRNQYDAYLQVMNRLEQYVVLGNIPQKLDVIVMGGTFPAMPEHYQREFIFDTFQAINDFSNLFFDEQGSFDFLKFREFFELPGEVGKEERTKSVQLKLLKVRKQTRSRWETLEKLQAFNDTESFVKCIGLTIETKPDWGLPEHANRMLTQGCTRVELGVQSVYEDVLKYTYRGHTLQHTIDSIRTLKDLGFKLNFHYMPGLPLTDRQRDVEGMKQLFSDPAFRPDMLKIYPCLVMPGTPLEVLYKQGKFKPITTKEAASLIAEFKQFVEPYCRIMRVQRDIPTYRTTAGVDRTNLRQYIDEELKKQKIICRCIRCREVGRNRAIQGDSKINVMEYAASEGKEFFISAESENALIGFCRLRFPSQCLREEITPTSALIRELHVYGSQANLGKVDQEKIQHRGWGQKLVKKAEEIALQHGKDKIIIISGVGVRDYFRRKLGYEQEGVYMVKHLGNALQR